ncbi:MAG: DNA mismatch repair endonuclease MutL [Phascolarctobacterium sp.]|uniref:DNA mismatch repair endonuclease MutL n=1 Tax=Phascolarctobacterium sp. TaxID=2049039 RepID=UPI0025E160C1|nr:DNA mismatch repair endonuclease MutL [Phascolarctobacterium sp.]MCC8158722.1 DNA mismatch repair endonuclease MutL [Phascolarctobacterium sp.]
MNEQKVQLLDQNTANQIAAGEVVEKPASVVKELVENSLDAGADNIEVTIFGGGTEYIRVVDNGSGMSEENAKLAVLRHATSKIRAAEDLLHLNTLGFRGEALPSIASVSNFQLLTRPVTEEFATSIKIEGGDQAECIATGGHTGTTIIVENLFFNVPARRKFLRTVQTESRYISELITKLALSRPDVRFKLISNDKEVLSTPGNGDLVETIKALYGKNVSEELLTVDFADSEVKVRGFIGKPTLLKGTRQWQTLLVNGRIITNRMIAKAIDHAYQSQIPKSGFPFAVLNINVDTESIDVNVHPQKSEIKFSDDSTVYKAMYKALTDALTRPMSAKPQDMTLLDDSELQVFKPAETAAEAAEIPAVLPESSENKPVEAKTQVLPASGSNTGAIKTEPAPEYKAQQQSVWKEPEYTYRPPKTEPVYTISETRDVFDKQDNIASNIIDFTDTDSGVDTIWPLGQVDRTFIVAQSEDSLFLIDQHAAHERILYDKLVAAHNDIPAQQMLIPLYIDVTSQDVNLIEEHREEFLRLGVDIEAAGEAMLRVSSLPADIKADDAEDFVREITQMLAELRTIDPSDLRQNILHMTACKAAIKAGEVLNMRQMRQLIIDLCNTEHPFTCPHGRPCMVEINSAELYKMFKRT